MSSQISAEFVILFSPNRTHVKNKAELIILTYIYTLKNMNSCRYWVRSQYNTIQAFKRYTSLFFYSLYNRWVPSYHI